MRSNYGQQRRGANAKGTSHKPQPKANAKAEGQQQQARATSYRQSQTEQIAMQHGRNCFMPSSCRFVSRGCLSNAQVVAGRVSQATDCDPIIAQRSITDPIAEAAIPAIQNMGGSNPEPTAQRRTPTIKRQQRQTQTTTRPQDTN